MCALGMGGSTGSRFPEVDRMAEKDSGGKETAEFTGNVFAGRCTGTAARPKGGG